MKKHIRKKHVNTLFLILLLASLVVFSIYSFKQNLFRKDSHVKLIATSPTPTIYVPLKMITDKINTTNDVSDILNDVNAYFKSKNRKAISRQNASIINNQDLLEKLESNDKNFIAIDIREKREREQLISLNTYPRLTYIRFGDLINNNFQPLPKNTEIIIVGFTENREIAAASYLLSEGYSNVKILKGGLLQWSLDNLPTYLNNYKKGGDNYVLDKDIASVLKIYTPKTLKKYNSTPEILTFGSYSPNSVSMLLWDTKTLETYIRQLSKKKKYLLFCRSDKYCYEATYFWYIAKKDISIIGYTQ